MGQSPGGQFGQDPIQDMQMVPSGGEASGQGPQKQPHLLNRRAQQLSAPATTYDTVDFVMEVSNINTRASDLTNQLAGFTKDMSNLVQKATYVMAQTAILREAVKYCILTDREFLRALKDMDERMRSNPIVQKRLGRLNAERKRKSTEAAAAIEKRQRTDSSQQQGPGQEIFRQQNSGTGYNQHQQQDAEQRSANQYDMQHGNQAVSCDDDDAWINDPESEDEELPGDFGL
ncbi:hypothetical protein SLS56_005045 [Neofusicoccum ribis]|uniref:Uncharacterized protein n=1 Tax=Neofusicoccum ribis TaxID=45134 RepID=A0ABR3SUZ0_9PEZI